MKNFKGWAIGTKLKVYSDEAFMNLKVPYYLIIGDKDPIYKKGSHTHIINKFNNMNNNLKTETIKGTHGFPIEQSEIVNEKILSYLREC